MVDFTRAQLVRTTEEAHEAGWNCALHGANSSNCHFSLFATPELTAAWEKGKAEGDRVKAEEQANEA